MRPTIFDCIVFVLLSVFSATQAFACVEYPSAEKTESDLRVLLDKADHVIIGRVSYITRRQWSEDDTQPKLNSVWRDVVERDGDRIDRQYMANWATYSEATAYLVPVAEVYRSGIMDDRRLGENGILVPIDMLRPFTVAGHGPCQNFPQTCPWDIKADEHIAVAIQENRFGAHTALICRKVERPGQTEIGSIRQQNRFITKFDAMLHYLADDYPFIQPDNLYLFRKQ